MTVGCAPVLDKMGSVFTTNNDTAMIITQGIVSEYLNANKASAKEIFTVSAEVMDFVDSQTQVSVDQLEAFVQSKLASKISKLTPQGQLAANDLIALLKVKLTAMLPANGVNLATYKLTVKTFFSWINATAKVYVPA
jgi:hypothetical protein